MHSWSHGIVQSFEPFAEDMYMSQKRICKYDYRGWDMDAFVVVVKIFDAAPQQVRNAATKMALALIWVRLALSALPRLVPSVKVFLLHQFCPAQRGNPSLPCRLKRKHRRWSNSRNTVCEEKQIGISIHTITIDKAESNL